YSFTSRQRRETYPHQGTYPHPGTSPGASFPRGSNPVVQELKHVRVQLGVAERLNRHLVTGQLAIRVGDLANLGNLTIRDVDPDTRVTVTYVEHERLVRQGVGVDLHRAQRASRAGRRGRRKVVRTVSP